MKRSDWDKMVQEWLSRDDSLAWYAEVFIQANAVLIGDGDVNEMLVEWFHTYMADPEADRWSHLFKEEQCD